MANIQQITADWCGRNELDCVYSESVDSTNTQAKLHFEGTAPMAVFLADHQSSGRGRDQRVWLNARPGSTLLSTWCLRVSASPQPIVPLRVGLLLYESFHRVWPGIPWSLKAPNDIYADTGKLAGILIEAEQLAGDIRLFIGVGANVLAKPAGVDQKTAALNEFTSFESQDWERFCDQWTRGLMELRKDVQRTLLTKDETERLLTALRRHPANPVEEILPNGGLIQKNGRRVHWNEL